MSYTVANRTHYMSVYIYNKSPHAYAVFLCFQQFSTADDFLSSDSIAYTGQHPIICSDPFPLEQYLIHILQRVFITKNRPKTRN